MEIWQISNPSLQQPEVQTKKNYIILPPIDIHVKKQVSFQIPASTRKYVHFVDPFPEIDET